MSDNGKRTRRVLSLALNIIFGSGFGLGVKAASMRDHDMIVVGGLNYITAAVFASIWLVSRGAFDFGWNGGVYGSLNGIGYFAAYFFFLHGVRNQGVAATRAIAGLGVLIPVLASVFVWGEYPTSAQFIGGIIAIGSVVLLDAKKNLVGEIIHGMRWRILVFFLLSGSSRLVAKFFAEAGVPDEKAFYVVMVFVASGATSVVMLARHRKMPTIGAIFWGSFVGACNMLQVSFMLRALEQLPGIVVFPATAAGGLILTATIAIVVLGERPTPRLYAGIAASSIAVFLLNSRTPGD